MKKCKICGHEFEHHFFVNICPECNSKKLSARARSSLRDYAFVRQEDCVIDESVMRSFISASNTVIKMFPAAKGMTLGDVIRVLNNRIADISMNRSIVDDWSDLLIGFAHEDIARAFLENTIIDFVNELPPFTQKDNILLGRYHRYRVVDYKIACSGKNYLGEKLSPKEQLVLERIIPELDKSFPGWRQCEKKFKPSLYLQGRLIKHYHNGNSCKVIDKAGLRPLVSANLKSLILKEFLNQNKWHESTE